MRKLIPHFKTVCDSIICPKCGVEIGFRFVRKTENVIAAFRKCPICHRAFNWKMIEKNIDGQLIKSLSLYLLLKGDVITDVE